MADDNKDIGSRLASQISKADAEIDKIVGGFERSLKTASDLGNILEKVVLTSSELPKGVKDAGDLLKKMVGDTKTFAKFEKQILDIQKKEINKALEKALKLRDQAVNRTKGQFAQTKLHFEVEKKIVEKQEEAFGILKRKLELEKKAAKEGGGNGHGLAKEVFLGTMLTGILEKVLQKLQPILSILNPFSMIFKAFAETWDFLDKKVIPTNAAINKQLGNMGEAIAGVKSEAVEAGVQFEMLGLPFEQGANAVREFFGAMNFIPARKEAEQLRDTALKLSEYVGLGGDGAGKLASLFQRTTGSVSDLNAAMDEATVHAKKYLVPVNQIRKDFGENLDILARFGIRNRTVMLDAIAKARSYGLSIRDVDAAFGKTMNTFEGTSEVAAKLNTVFGTNINSLELMLETNPVKRMEMVRQSLNKQGLAWENLGASEKDVLTTTLSLTEEKAALAFSSENVRKQLEKEAKAQEKAAKVQNDWNKALGSLKSTLLPLTALIDNFLRSFANWFSKMLGFENSTEAVSKGAKVIEKFFNNLTGYFDGKVVSGAQSITKSFSQLTDKIGSKEFAANIGRLIEALPTTIAKITPFFVDKLPAMLEMIEKIVKKVAGFLGIEDPDEIRAKEESRQKSVADTMTKQGTIDQAVQTVLKAKSGEKITKYALQQLKMMERSNDAGIFRKLLAEKGVSGQDLDKVVYGKATKVDDALITKKGEVIKFHKDDNIIATKSNSTAQAAAGLSPSSMNSGGGGSTRIEIIDINLDGRKVGEGMVRISRA